MKKWWQSKTILASLFTAVTICVGLFSPELSTKLTLESTEIVSIVAAISGLATTALAIYGRLTSRTEIK